MSTTPQFTHEQLTAARAQRWHQAAQAPAQTGDQPGEQSGNPPGDALLTLDAARDWIAELGLVLFAPRAQQLAAPAPSLVEATLGHASASPTAAETETARSLVARLTADGAALPLNLLGAQTTAGDTPDFIVSAQVFGYIFTLRGDKAWKQPPSTSGAIKVSPLALKVYELLAEGKTASNAMTAAEIVSELGREVTQNAILRALNELWSQLRVLPLLQQDGSATMWELTTRRFTKQLKSGANAGQPTALSALISLYLAQVYAALEEEIETFLSPLAARSRVRDVLHGLTTGRQLEDIVLEGKRLLYIPGELPEFPEIAAEQPAEGEGAAEIAASSEAAKPAERIRRFDGPRKPREDRPRAPRGDRPYAAREDRPRASRPRPSGGERPRPYRAAGAARPFGGDRPARSFSADRERPRKPFADKRNSPRAPRTEGKSFGDRERRPFQRDAAKPARPSFTRPWDEDRKPRERGEQAERPRREDRPRVEGDWPRDNERPRAQGERPRPYGDRPRREASARPAGGKDFRPRTDRGDRPSRAGGADRPSRPFRSRSQEGEGARPPRRDQEERPRRQASARPSTGRKEFRPRPDRGDGPPRERGANRPDRAARPFRPRPQGSEGTRPQKRFRSAGEDGGDAGARRPSGFKPAGKRAFGAKPAGKRPFGAKPFGKSGGSFAKPGGFGKRAPSGSRPPRASDAARPPRGPNDSRPPRGVNPRTAKRTKPNAKPNPPRETEE